METSRERSGLNDLILYRKKWGWELWFANTVDYCGKEIFISNGCVSSGGLFHYHKIKDETFYVLEGELILDFMELDGKYKSIQSVTLKPGQIFRIRPNVKHRFRTDSISGCRFIEVSTHHEDSDSYRCDISNETSKNS